MKSWVGLLGIISVVMLTAIPARATVTATLSAVPKSYSSNCPTDIAFSGSIYLSGAGTLNYRFARSDGSLSPQNGFFSHTFPAAGTYTTADAMYKVSKSGSDKLQVYNPNGGALLVTATAPFTIACAKPPPTPAPTPGGGGVDIGGAGRPAGKIGQQQSGGLLPITGAFIPPPTGLTYTTDPTVCAPHLPIPLFAGPVCQSAIEANKLILIWDWSSASCPSTAVCPSGVDGYRVYPRENRSLAATVVVANSSGAATMASLDPNASPSGCYAVKAYKADLESDQSNIFCLRGSAQLGSKSINLPPARVRVTFWYYSRWTTVVHHPPTADVSHTDSPAATNVGYGHHTEKKWDYDIVNSGVYRSYIWFDLQQFQGKAIQKAVLHLHEDSTDRNVAEDALCAKYFGTASEDWEAAGGSRIYAEFPDTLPANTVDLALDVTDQVRAWLNGAPNFGFALKGSDEGNPFNDNRCITKYSGISLDVEYFQ